MLGTGYAPTVVLLLIALAAPSARAEVVGGGGGATTDCLVVFDAAVNTPSKRPRHVRCTDGDPSCDADGVVDGVCSFAVKVCANSTFNDPKCTLAGVDEIDVRYAIDNGDPKFDPDFQALQQRIDNDIDPPTAAPNTCTGTVTLRIPIDGPYAANKCRKRRKIIRIDALSTPQQGRFKKDRDKLKLTCDPAPPAGCDPQVLFTGTFDRIKKQIFNQSCAVSGCHDSQSFIASGVLLLEDSAAYGNLVDVQPVNAAAQAQGWKRVTPGDPDASFIVHKLAGDFPGGADFGERMPRGRKKLDTHLRDIITLWIVAGAPETGWVAGTD
jgi:hypothetical protein